MKPNRSATLMAGLLVTLTSSWTSAQSVSNVKTAPVLHVNNKYSDCFFDLHPELTQAQFKEFTEELGSILRPSQLGDATPLRRGRVAVGLDFSGTPIDDSKGAWNNTMSHPTADHELGSSIRLPRLVARVGVSDRVDIGVAGGFSPHANYGFASIDATVVLMKQGPARPVSIAIRPGLSSLIGPDEVWVGNASFDVSISRRFGAWSPYLGFSSSASFGVERTKDVDLKNEVATTSPVYAGLSYEWQNVVISAEAEHGKVNRYGLRLSRRF